MVVFSESFHKTSARVFTFAGIAFTLKIIPLKAVTVSDVNIQLENMPVAIGMIAFLVIYLIIFLGVIAVQDVIRQRIIDLRETEKERASMSVDLLTKDNSGASSASTGYLRISVIYLWLEAIFPILFGILVVVLCASDILSFISHLSSVIRLEFWEHDSTTLEGNLR